MILKGILYREFYDFKRNLIYWEFNRFFFYIAFFKEFYFAFFLMNLTHFVAKSNAILYLNRKRTKSKELLKAHL